MIYHITTQDQWETAEHAGNYTAPSLAEEGFIHCSSLQQVTQVANRFYRDLPDLILLCLDEDRLSAEIKWEAPAHPDGSPTLPTEERFPHVYGKINLAAVHKVLTLPKNDDLQYILPEELA